MTVLPVQSLMAPLAESEPSGPDLAEDPGFSALERAAMGKPGTQFAPGEPPSWPLVREQALMLARRTRDLRLAVLLARAGSYTDGLPGYAQGLSLVAGLLETLWDTVHPQLDAEDNNDATMRLNALGPLGDFATGLTDLRASLVGAPGSGLTVRLVELAWSKAETAAGESRPTQVGILQGLRDAATANPQVVPALRAVAVAVATIERVVSVRVGTAGPDFKALVATASCCAHAADHMEGLTSPVDGSAATTVAAAGRAATTDVGGIQTREDVVRLLGQVCDWVERNEPSNPAPLLIRRAQRLMSKSFLDLVKDLAPQGLSQIEQIAGVTQS